MKQRSSLALALALFVLSSGMALAQYGGRGGMRGPSTGLQMLRIAEVQKELKMTPEQIGKLDAKQQEVRDSLRGLFQGGYAQLNPEERQQRTEKMQELQDKAAADILNAPQQKRFLELELQRQGPAAITRKAVTVPLKLTDGQQTKIAALGTQADADRQAAMQGVDFRNMSADDRQKMSVKMQDVQKAEGDKILALLTEGQKTQWKQMQGATFTFPTPAGAAPAAAGAAPAAIAAPKP